eukprot:gene4492-4745_t
MPAAFGSNQAAMVKVQVADFSHNLLQRMPKQVLAGMPQLVVLSVSSNRLKSVELMGLRLIQVRVLDLSFNKLSSLPEDMGKLLPALQQLYLSNNFLTTLPESLDTAPLQDVFVSENELCEVPKVLSRCRSLAKLSLAACQLAAVGNELSSLTALRFLDLSFNKLAALPSSMGSLGKLTSLNLGFNPLNSFPDAVCSMLELRELNIDNTGVSSFPTGLGELRQLEALQAEGCHLVAPFAALYSKDPLMLVKLHDVLNHTLDMSDLELEQVPPQILRLSGLTSLNLSKNAIKDLPQELGQLDQLVHVSLRGNPLRQPYLKILDSKGEQGLLRFLSPAANNTAAAMTLPNQGLLDIEGCGFEAVPKEVWSLPDRTALKALNLINNRLKDLPEELSNLIHLTRVVLDNNLLRHMPNVILGLPSLAVLMASHNSITYLPDTLGKAQRLQVLIVHMNQLMQLPDSISSLTNLRALGTTACTSLRLLDCSHNMMNKLPGGLTALSRLRSLKLTHNKLSRVPTDELQQLQFLEELQLAGNNIKVNVDLNASDMLAVQELLYALADSEAGTAPASGLAGTGHHSSSSSNMINGLPPAAASGTAPAAVSEHAVSHVSQDSGAVALDITGMLRALAQAPLPETVAAAPKGGQAAAAGETNLENEKLRLGRQVLAKAIPLTASSSTGTASGTDTAVQQAQEAAAATAAFAVLSTVRCIQLEALALSYTPGPVSLGLASLSTLSGLTQLRLWEFAGSEDGPISHYRADTLEGELRQQVLDTERNLSDMSGLWPVLHKLQYLQLRLSRKVEPAGGSTGLSAKADALQSVQLLNPERLTVLHVSENLSLFPAFKPQPLQMVGLRQLHMQGCGGLSASILAAAAPGLAATLTCLDIPIINADNGLSGCLSSLGLLTNLRHLDASYSRIAGTIPDDDDPYDDEHIRSARRDDWPALAQLRELTFLALGVMDADTHSCVAAKVLQPLAAHLTSLDLVRCNLGHYGGNAVRHRRRVKRDTVKRMRRSEQWVQQLLPNLKWLLVEAVPSCLKDWVAENDRCDLDDFDKGSSEGSQMDSEEADWLANMEDSLEDSKEMDIIFSEGGCESGEHGSDGDGKYVGGSDGGSDGNIQ